ncbi:phytoene desaturase family protein [Peredibacter starrii]|uniref:NAD(P)-binding protein n=1 Tax=Peredibacter starrii TaxID=28202 RepID=A0AAX4HKZ3_9BACT|nr:NAD(P)-binding protein [Peredibacter starrii]WPU63944.1 NAD(P)-binding protein [Peredibacter starrii]
MKTLVVGAGGGGIASALLAGLRGEETTLVEAHASIGGCASYFKRGPFVFDVGATTVSGIGEDEPLGRLFSLLGSKPDLVPADPGIVFHLSSGKTLSYYRDFEKWMRELEKNFPELNHRPFWSLVQKVNRDGWRLLRNVHTFPPQNLNEFFSILNYPASIKLLPNLFLSTELMLKHFGLFEKEYLELINGILIISAQSESHKTPFMVGAMALAYPSETYVPVGGMKGLMDYFERELERLKITVKKKTKVTELPKEERVILNLPVWNLAELSNEFTREAETHPGHWGSFVLYFGVKSEISSPYHQIHLNHPDVKNYFVSFSLPGDNLRAHVGYQTVVISTHEIAKSWYVLSEEEYLARKKHLEAIIMDDFKSRFKVDEIKFLMSGTPKTFESFTGRKFGFVGGVPFLHGKNPFSLLSPVTNLKEVYRVGDTIFPGQGLCGVVAGALQLHDRLR